jgi:hypothetical protein
MKRCWHAAALGLTVTRQAQGLQMSRDASCTVAMIALQNPCVTFHLSKAAASGEAPAATSLQSDQPPFPQQRTASRLLVMAQVGCTLYTLPLSALGASLACKRN